MAARDKKARELMRLRRALARAEQAVAEAERQLLSPHQLCASDLEILARLARKGRQRVNALAQRVGLTSGSITTAVQRLLKRGLVETQRDTADKRVVWVETTAEGQFLARELSAQRTSRFEEVLETWSTREQAILTNFLKRLRRDAQGTEPGGTSGG